MRKKVCFVVSSPRSAIGFFGATINRLASDFDVYLVANYDSNDQLKGLSLKGSRSIPIERRPKIWRDIKALNQLYKYFREEHFQIVLSMSSKPSLLTSIAGFFARIPHRIRIFTGQLWCNMKGLKRFFFKTIDRITVALDTELLADGHPQREYLIKERIVKAGKIEVLANGSICGIDADRFQFNDSVREEVRNELNAKDKVVFVFLGRLKREKGIRELLGAYNRLAKDCKDSLLLLLGRDEENCVQWLPDYEYLKSGENVIFYGFTPRPYDMLMGGDVFCMPSYREGFGVSVLEASCIGLPVICSDTYGMIDTMVDNVTGLRCKVMDEDSLYDAMKVLHDDPELRTKLGKNGHDRVISDFSQQLVVDAWVEFFQRLK